MAALCVPAVALATTMAEILTCYYRPKTGGLFARYMRAIGALLAAGHRVHYLALAPYPIDHPRCVFHRFPWPLNRSDSLLFWTCFFILAPLQLTWIALRYRVQQAFCFDIAYALLFKPLLWMGRLVPTCFIRGDAQAALNAQQGPRWLIWMLNIMEGIALNRIRVVAPGPHIIHDICGRHPKRHPAAVFELPNDLPTVAVRSSPKPVHGHLQMATVGRLTPLKNNNFILDVLKDFPDRGYRLSLFGKGPEAVRLSQLVERYHLAGRVNLAGWVAVDQIWPQVDLLLAPAQHEGMPNAVLEAVANGVPVLASDIAGHRMVLPQSQCLPLDNSALWR